MLNINININIDYNCERENEELYKLLNRNNVLKWEYDKDSKYYDIESTYETDYSNKTVCIGDHYKFNYTLHKLYRYDFLDLNIIENFSLMDKVDEHFPVIKKFIDHNDIKTIPFRIVNPISIGKYKNSTTELVRDQLIYSLNYQITETLLILALIKAMTFDDPSQHFSLYSKHVKQLLQLFDKFKLSNYKIFNLIDCGLCSGNLHNNKHDVLGNVVVSNSPINQIQNMYEFKFISASHAIFSRYRSEELNSFLKEGIE